KGKPPNSRRLLGALQSALRDPGTVLLAATTAGYLAIAVFGAALVPRPGSLRPDQANLSLTLRLPPGATLEETARRAAKAEELLAKAEEVERFWSYSIPGLARITAELKTGARTPEGRSLVATRLRYGL